MRVWMSHGVESCGRNSGALYLLFVGDGEALHVAGFVNPSFDHLVHFDDSGFLEVTSVAKAALRQIGIATDSRETNSEQTKLINSNL